MLKKKPTVGSFDDSIKSKSKDKFRPILSDRTYMDNFKVFNYIIKLL